MTAALTELLTAPEHVGADKRKQKLSSGLQQQLESEDVKTFTGNNWMKNKDGRSVFHPQTFSFLSDEEETRSLT